MMYLIDIINRLNFLTEIFEKLKYEKVITHIGNNYITQLSCTNEELEKELKNRIDKYEKVSIGKPAPLFEIADYK